MLMRSFIAVFCVGVFMTSTAVRAQDDLDAGALLAMQEAYAIYQEGDFDKASKAYQLIEEAKGATASVRQAALNGRLMAELAGLRATQAAGQTGFLEKSRVNKLLRLAQTRQSSFTFDYLSVVAQSSGPLGVNSFAGTALEDDYTRLALRQGLSVAEPALAVTAPQPFAQPVISTPARLPTPKQTALRYYEVLQTVNIRGGPGTGYRKVGALQAGSAVPVVGIVQDTRARDWAVLDNNGGYVFASYLRQLKRKPKSATSNNPRQTTPTSAPKNPVQEDIRGATKTAPKPAPKQASCGTVVIGRFKVLKPIAVLAAPRSGASIVGKMKPGDEIRATQKTGGYIAFRVDGACRYVGNIRGALTAK